MTLDLRLRLYAPNGASLGYLPAPDSVSASDPLNDIPALTLNYGVAAPQANLLGQPCEVALETSGDGGATWAEPLNGRYLYLRDGRDPLKTADAYQVEAPGYGWLLKKARLLAGAGWIVNGKRQVQVATTVGSVFLTWVNEAKARGTLAGLNVTWTATNDSAGVAWPVDLTGEFDLGVDLLTVLLDFAQKGRVDWRFSGRDLQLYVPPLTKTGTNNTMARDLTVGANPVAISPLNSGSAPFRRTWEGLASRIISRGEGDAVYVLNNAGALKPWGDWEDYITNSGVSDIPTLTTLASQYAMTTDVARTELTQDIGTDAPSAPRPGIDFRTGDYIWSRSLSGAPAKYRVRQMTLTKSGDQVEANVILNDRFAERDIQVQRRLDALAGGASVGGSTGNPPGADILPPAAPGTVVLTAGYYFDGSNVPHATVTVNWPDVVTNMDGTAITDLAQYEVYGKRSADPGWTLLTTTPAADSIAYLSGFDPGVSWDFRVRAIDNAGNLSAFSVPSTLVMPTDTTAPATPSQPGASSAAGLISVTWDGKNSVGATQAEPDLRRVEIHVSGVTGFTPIPGDSTTMRGAFDGPGRQVVSGETVGSTRYIRLVAVDTTGNASAASVQRSVVVVNTSTDATVPPAPAGVTLKPLGLMSLTVSWPAVTNQDAVVYDVYASTTTPVVRDAAHFIGTQAGTTQDFSNINGVALVASQDYYAAVTARDADGSSSSAGTAGPTQVAQGGSGSIDPAWTYLGNVSASQIAAGNIAATVGIIGELTTAASGRRVSLSSLGLKAIDSNGDVVVSIPTDPTQGIQLQADVTATSLTVTGKASFRDAANELGKASGLILRNATAPPVTAPTVAITYDQITVETTNPSRGMGGNYYAAGLRTYQVWDESSTLNAGVWVFDNTGAHVPAEEFSLVKASNTDKVMDVVRIGSGFYVLTHLNTTSPTPTLAINLYDATTKAKNATTYTMTTGTLRPISHVGNLTYDGTTLWAVYVKSPSEVRAAKFTGLTGANIPSAPTDVQIATTGFSFGIDGAQVATVPDIGTPTLFLQYPGTGLVRAFQGLTGTITAAPNYDFPINGGTTTFRMLVWNSTLGCLIAYDQGNGKWTLYNGQTWTTESSTWYIVNTWRDTDPINGTHETTMGPATVITMKKRARLTITSPPIPDEGGTDDPNAVSVYIGRVAGARTDQWRQTLPADGIRTLNLAAVVFTGTNPPATNNFPGATPAIIKSEVLATDGLPKFWVDGSGAGRWDAKIGEDTGWIDAPLANGWNHYDLISFGPVQYRRMNGIVYVRGLGVWNTNPANTCWTMPAGFRPLRHHLIAALTNLGTARLDFRDTGQVIFINGTGGTVAGTNSYHSFATSYPAA